MMRIIVATVCLTSLSAFSDPVGKMITPAKEVSAKTLSGVSRALAFGDSFAEKEEIVVGQNERRNVQFRFRDGTLIACAPNAHFRIDEYQYEKKSTDRLVGSFLQGGCRVLSGQIDVKNSAGQSWKTPTAVMGLAGTMFSASVDGTKSRVGFYKGSAHVETADCTFEVGEDSCYDYALFSPEAEKGSAGEMEQSEALLIKMSTEVDEASIVKVNENIMKMDNIEPLSAAKIRKIESGFRVYGSFHDSLNLKLQDRLVEFRGAGNGSF